MGIADGRVLTLLWVEGSPFTVWLGHGFACWSIDGKLLNGLISITASKLPLTCANARITADIIMGLSVLPQWSTIACPNGWEKTSFSNCGNSNSKNSSDNWGSACIRRCSLSSLSKRLAALVPKPKVNLTRFHGVFAPNSKLRIQVTPAKRGKGSQQHTGTNTWLEKTPEERHCAMAWMQRLELVFGIDIETSERCGGKVKVIASIEDPAVIAHILKHLKQKEALQASIQPHELPPKRAPPQVGLFDPSQSRL